MKTLMKVVGWIIAIFVLIYIIAAILVHTTISSKTYNELISKLIYKTTGHQANISGKTRIAIFPSFSLRTGQITITNPTGFRTTQNPYLAKIGTAQVNISIWPLFAGKVHPTSIVLKNAYFNIVQNKNGQANWMLPSQPSPMKKQPSPTHSMPNKPMHHAISTDSSISQQQTINLPKISVINANLNYVDQQSGKQIHLTHFNLHLKANSDGSHININTNAFYQSQQQKPIPVSAVLDYERNDRNINISPLNLTFNHLRFRGSLLASAENNIAKGVLKGYFAGGQLRDTFNVNTRGIQPVFSTELTLNNAKLASITSAFLQNESITGNLNIQTKLKTYGKNQNIMLRHLSGNGSIKAQDGAIHGLDMQHTFNQGLQSFQKGQKPTLKNGITTFDQISATYTISTGILTNNDLLIDSNKLHATGKGSINLPAQSIDYHVLIFDPKNQKFKIPLLVTGNLQHPKINLDLQSLTFMLIKNRIKHNIGSKLGDKLKHLFSH